LSIGAVSLYKSILLATSPKYCKKTFNQSGGLVSSETISLTVGSEYTINPPDNVGYITIEVGEC
jgi:hypothetical protein